MKYVQQNDIKIYQSILLLNELINTKREFNTIFNGDDKIIENLFIDLLSKGYVEIFGSKYRTTNKGLESFNLFMRKYKEYLKLYDIFAFVDLQKGEFAFSKYFDFPTDALWDDYKNDTRFEDVRLAVALYKKINPTEIVFMSFINENRFDLNKTGWQIDLLSDEIWKEIDDICISCLKASDLGENDVIEDIIDQGSKLLVTLLKKDREIKEENYTVNRNNSVENKYEIEKINEEIDIYEGYTSNIYYVSPCWMIPILIF